MVRRYLFGVLLFLCLSVIINCVYDPTDFAVAIVIFAAAVPCWSLANQHLSKKHVDWIYYLFGIVGIVIFFLAGQKERRLASLDREYFALHDSVEDSKARLMDYDLVLTKAEDCYKSLQASATPFVVIPPTFVRATELAMDREHKALEARKQALDEYCTKLRNTPYDKIQTLPDLPKGVTGEMQVDGRRLSTVDLFNWLRDPSGFAERVQEQRERARALATKLEHNRTNAKAITNDPASGPKWAKLVRIYWWPFVGIFLLGLKLARAS